MKLSELILQVGDENVKLQNLMESATGAKLKKNGDTEISFLTREMTPDDLMRGQADVVGLVVWLPKNRLPF